MATFFDYIKNIFWLLLILQVAPPLIKNVKKQYSELLEPKTKVGLMEIKGTIESSACYVQDLKKLFENEEIKAILIKIECPGGASGAAQAVFNEIKALRKEHTDKYTVALVENLAASGGYYIASAAHYIIACPAALIGSIGAYISHPYFKDFIESWKIKYDIVKSGTYKTAGNPFVESTPEQKSEFQSLTDNVYKQFINDVSQQRHNLPSDTKKWADGKIFTGEQALELKLIDEIGSLSNAIKVIRENAHIEGKIDWIKPERKTNLLKTLLSQDEDCEQTSFLAKAISQVCRIVEDRYSGHQAQ